MKKVDKSVPQEEECTDAHGKKAYAVSPQLLDRQCFVQRILLPAQGQQRRWDQASTAPDPHFRHHGIRVEG